MSKIVSFRRKKYFETDNFSERYKSLETGKQARVATMLLGFFSRQTTEQGAETGDLEYIFNRLHGEYLEMFLAMVNDQVIDSKEAET